MTPHIKRRIEYYQTTAISATDNRITHSGGSSIVSIVTHLFMGSWAVLSAALSVADILIVHSIRFIIKGSVRIHNKVNDTKALMASDKQVFASIEPEVKALVSEFIDSVKHDPSKTVWYQRRFQISLINKLTELSSEFDLELDVHKLALAIVKVQAPIMVAAVRIAEERRGKLISRDQLMNLKDVEVINKSLEDTLKEERAHKRYKRY